LEINQYPSKQSVAYLNKGADETTVW